MHNAAFAALGLSWRYHLFPVSPTPHQRLTEAMYGLRALGLAGANVTLPHKVGVLDAVDVIRPNAAQVGAANLILVRDGLLIADNTDVGGLLADLQAHDVTLAGSHVLMLGAGGAARAGCVALASADAASITIVNRTLSRAGELKAALRPLYPNIDWRCASPDALKEHAPSASLIINATSVGMAPDVDAMPWPDNLPMTPGQTLYDMVYTPSPTRLMRYASQSGVRAIGGLGMLLHQAALAFTEWTGHVAPLEIMRAALQGHD